MRVHVLQHIPFEGLASMAPYFEEGHTLTATRLFAGDPLPAPEDIDWLIIMGGLMGVHDEAEYPWLREEKRFIRDCIDAGKLVLGVCLGAQLIAHVLGATVRRNTHREIGWFQVVRNLEVGETYLRDIWPERFNAFHWHGDTFSLPEGAIALGASEACPNQGFLYGGNVVALQCHLETTPDAAKALIDNCADEMDGSKYVQSEAVILADAARFGAVNQTMGRILRAMEQQAGDL